MSMRKVQMERGEKRIEFHQPAISIQAISPPQFRLDQLEHILDSLSEFVCRFTADGVYTYVNLAYAQLTGKPREAIIGQPVLPLIRDESVRDLLTDLMANPRRMTHRHRYQYPDGTIEYDEWTEEPIYDADGNIIELQSVGRDITAAVTAQEAQRQAEAQYRLLAKNLPDTAVFIYDHELYFRLVEGPLLGQAGFDGAWLEGKHALEVAPVEFVATAEATYRSALNGERGMFDAHFLGMDLQASVAPLRDDSGQVIGGLILVQNVTSRRQIEKEALRSVLEQETAALLAGFIRDTSHDLRTPLAVIVTNTYLLRRSTAEPSQLQRLDLIDRQVKRLERLINELHLMSSLDATERDQLNRHPLDLHQLIQNVVTTNNSPLLEKNQQLHLNLEPGLTPPLNADESQLVLVIMNLIENAHLYSPAGATLEVRTRFEAEQAIIQVRDSGEGIEARHLPYIFDRFYKVDAARSTNRGGAGLGLAIVRKIVTLHGGVVTVDSTPGVGSTFTVRLPLNPPA